MSTVMQESLPRHRITVEEYHRMADVGLLAPDARVELLEGEIFDMPPIGDDHKGVVNLLNHLFVRAVGEHAIVQVQNSVRLGWYSEPEPDLALLRPRDDFYRSSPTRADDVLLLVEVSDSTLRHDLRKKVPLYARHEIPEVWIVDLSGGQLHVFQAPQEGRYSSSGVTQEPGTPSPALLPDVRVDLAKLFAS